MLWLSAFKVFKISATDSIWFSSPTYTACTKLHPKLLQYILSPLKLDPSPSHTSFMHHLKLVCLFMFKSISIIQGLLSIQCYPNLHSSSGLNLDKI